MARSVADDCSLKSEPTRVCEKEVVREQRTRVEGLVKELLPEAQERARDFAANACKVLLMLRLHPSQRRTSVDCGATDTHLGLAFEDSVGIQDEAVT